MNKLVTLFIQNVVLYIYFLNYIFVLCILIINKIKSKKKKLSSILHLGCWVGVGERRGRLRARAEPLGTATASDSFLHYRTGSEPLPTPPGTPPTPGTPPDPGSSAGTPPREPDLAQSACGNPSKRFAADRISSSLVASLQASFVFSFVFSSALQRFELRVAVRENRALMCEFCCGLSSSLGLVGYLMGRHYHIIPMFTQKENQTQTAYQSMLLIFPNQKEKEKEKKI